MNLEFEMLYREGLAEKDIIKRTEIEFRIMENFDKRLKKMGG